MKSKLDYKVHIVEKNKTLHRKFRDNPKLDCHFDFKKIKERNIDLLINTTPANNRYKLIKIYNSFFNIKYFILKKLLKTILIIY